MKNIISLTGHYLSVLILLIVFCFHNDMTAQIQLDVAGDSKIAGQLEIIKAVGDSSIYIGARSGFNYSGTMSTFLGANTGRPNSGGSWNTFIGYNAGISNGSSGNTFIGRGAGKLNNSYSNLFIGNVAGRDNTGYENTIIGTQAGLFSNGFGHVFIGAFAGISETGNNKLYIDNSNTTTPLIYGEFDNDLVRINGTLGISTLTNVNTADSVIVLLPNGELGIRDAPTLANNQMLSLSNDTIFLTDGGFVVLPSEIDICWSESGSSPALSIPVPPTIMDTLTLTKGGSVNDSSYIKVCLDISHSWVEDLDITLFAPNRASIDLSSDNGGSNDNYTNTCFVSDATTSITTGTAPFTGDFLPEGNFTVFNGSPISGDWILKVEDDLPASDDGTLNMWSIEIKSQVNIKQTDLDPMNEIQNLTEVLTKGNDGGALQIKNLADPTVAQDAMTKSYFDSNDGLGDHLATENLQTKGFYISNDGDNEGLFVESDGSVGLGTNTPTNLLDVSGGIAIGSSFAGL